MLEDTTRSEAAAARRTAFENGEITGAHAVTDGPTEHRSHWDTRLNTSTTPRSALADWDPPAGPPATQSETNGSSDTGKSEVATPPKPEE
jgi:hypothetical protein